MSVHFSCVAPRAYTVCLHSPRTSCSLTLWRSDDQRALYDALIVRRQARRYRWQFRPWSR